MGNNQNRENRSLPHSHTRSGSCPQLPEIRGETDDTKKTGCKGWETPEPASPVPMSPPLSPFPLTESGPIFESILYSCPDCERQCFDGCMPKSVTCTCGANLLRTDEGQISKIPQTSYESLFEASFFICTTQFSGVLADLEIATFGLYGDSPASDSSLHSELRTLHEFFSQRKRLINEGECFECRGQRLKVLSCYPSQGFVTHDTALFCSDSLSMQWVERVHLAPLAPHVITTDLHGAIVKPYFETTGRHVHCGQYFCMNGLECVVTRITPENGIVTSSTVITFDTQPLHTIKSLKLTPYLEDLPSEIQRMDRVSNMKSVFQSYLLPYFKGWRRLVSHGQAISIYGTAFRIDSIRPLRGVVTDNTTIVYHGRAASRRAELEKQIQQDEALARSLQDNLEPSITRIHRLSRNPETRDMLLQVIEMLHVISATGGPEGASQQQINLLPTHKITPGQLRDHSKCLICLCEFESEESVRTLPCCNLYIVHLFHIECVDRWLSSNKVCPVCKTPADYRPQEFDR